MVDRSASPRVASTAAAQVLLIDDDRDIRMLTRMALELDGYRVADAANGLRGLDLLARVVEEGGRPVVVLDVQMPDIDGWEVLARIRGEPSFATIPVVMCTVRAGVEDRGHGYALGADAYEAKPYEVDRFLETVTRLLELPAEELLARRAQISGSEGVC